MNVEELVEFTQGVSGPGTRVTFTCSGHPAIRATHKKTLEFTRAHDITAKATCVIGVAADFKPSEIKAIKGRVHVSISCGNKCEEFEATVARASQYKEGMVFRVGAELADCTFAYHATKAANHISRNLIGLLRQTPSPKLFVSLTQIARRRFHSGVLYVVALPIGNAADLSPRAREILQSVDRILAEDPAKFRALAKQGHFSFAGVESIPYGHHVRSWSPLLRYLRSGRNIALVTNAGTPTLGDPGTYVVRRVAAAGIHVRPVPGPSAVCAAVSASSLANGEFLFVRGLPRRASDRRSRLEQLQSLGVPLVIFEVPQRLLASLKDIEFCMPDRQAFLARDMTKVHEEFFRGTVTRIRELVETQSPLVGEFTLVIGPGTDMQNPAARSDHKVRQFIAALADDIPTKTLARALQSVTGMTRRSAYDEVLMILGSKIDTQS